MKDRVKKYYEDHKEQVTLVAVGVTSAVVTAIFCNVNNRRYRITGGDLLTNQDGTQYMVLNMRNGMTTSLRKNY